MPHYIIKLVDPETKQDYYLEWSTIVDAPITIGMTFDDFRQYYREEYGESGMRGLEERMTRVEQKGTSCLHGDLASVLSCNRAGPGETELSEGEMLKRYCTEIPADVYGE